MTATTAHGITYPTGSDKIKDMPDHLKQMADSIDTAITGQNTLVTNATTAANNAATAANNARPVVVATKTALNAVNATAGRIGIVTNDTSGNNGPYIHNGTRWTRGGTTVPAELTNLDLTNNDSWDASDSKAYLFMGMMLLNIRVTRKTENWTKNCYELEKIAKLGPLLRPPHYYHFRAFATSTPARVPDVGILVQPDGTVMVESLADNMTIVRGTLITCPCIFPTAQF